MSVLTEEEKNNQALISAPNTSANSLQTVTITPSSPPAQAQASALQASFPGTSDKLQSILKKRTTKWSFNYLII